MATAYLMWRLHALWVLAAPALMHLEVPINAVVLVRRGSRPGLLGVPPAGFCKQQLWPLFHYLLPLSPNSSGRFDPDLWQAYVKANKVRASLLARPPAAFINYPLKRACRMLQACSLGVGFESMQVAPVARVTPGGFAQQALWVARDLIWARGCASNPWHAGVRK